MKKILLSLTSICALGLSAQTIYSENFNVGNPFVNGWTVIDANTDGDNWQILDLTGFGTVFDAQDVVALSGSTIPGQTNFSPDNMFISPSINITLQNSANDVRLSFKMGSELSTASGNYDEYMSVYVVPSGSVLADILAATPVYSGAITQGQVMQIKTADLTAFAGQSNLKVVFRHHNCTDLSAVFLDDIIIEEVAASTLSLQCGSAMNVYFNTDGNLMPQVNYSSSTSCTTGTLNVTQSPAAGSVLFNGENDVLVTATDGCGNTESCQVVVNFYNNVGVSELTNNSFLIYPNPVSEILNLNVSDNKLAIKIFNINGKLEFQTNENVSQLNVSNLSSGVYFINVETEKGSFMNKFIKK